MLAKFKLTKLPHISIMKGMVNDESEMQLDVISDTNDKNETDFRMAHSNYEWLGL